MPGATPESILAAQNKLHARRVLQQVAPEANLGFMPLDAAYGDPAPEGLHYPCVVKPVKPAFSVLARQVASRDELQAHTRFGHRELWVIRRLVEPFDRICRARLPQAVQQLALQVAQWFLQAIGYTHGFFNLEFFHDPASGGLSVIDCNPCLASQFGDLYQRVLGTDAHAMAVALACGEEAAAVPRQAPRAAFAHQHRDALLFCFPKRGHGLERDFKWTGSHRYGIVHLGARDRDQLREQAERASALLGWAAPCLDQPQPAMLLVLAWLLSGCSALSAQNPPGTLKPVNATTDANGDRLMLKGADVVAHFTLGRVTPGSAQFSSRYQDITFRFASAEHKALFDASPQRYLPQYGGYCANGIVYAIPLGGRCRCLAHR